MLKALFWGAFVVHLKYTIKLDGCQPHETKKQAMRLNGIILLKVFIQSSIMPNESHDPSTGRFEPRKKGSRKQIKISIEPELYEKLNLMPDRIKWSREIIEAAIADRDIIALALSDSITDNAGELIEKAIANKEILG